MTRVQVRVLTYTLDFGLDNAKKKYMVISTYLIYTLRHTINLSRVLLNDQSVTSIYQVFKLQVLLLCIRYNQLYLSTTRYRYSSYKIYSTVVQVVLLNDNEKALQVLKLNIYTSILASILPIKLNIYLGSYILYKNLAQDYLLVGSKNISIDHKPTSRKILHKITRYRQYQ